KDTDIKAEPELLDKNQYRKMLKG
ncbi:hypothetical protein MQI_02735, partial [Staphylococcus aureus subsp. aureus VRS5]